MVIITRYKRYKELAHRYNIPQLVHTSVLIDDKAPTQLNKYKTQVFFKEMSTHQAINKVTKPHIGVLHFASWMMPGGFYWTGLKTQEETLCEYLPLIHILRNNKWKNEYWWQRFHPNGGLYTNRAIYSRIPRKGRTIDICTCPAPNYTIYKLSHIDSVDHKKFENIAALISRCEFVLNCFAQQNCPTIILGAYGCGAVGQNPTIVAQIFKNLLRTKYKGVFQQVVFAIPQRQNIIAFRNVFASED